jgi:SAM-dependent methyltransferase
MHEIIQFYLEGLYCSFKEEITQSYYGKGNEIYGELYYYSVVKLLKYLKLSQYDHFLDVGSGLGRLIFQVFLETEMASVSGIEINARRYDIACKIKETLKQQMPFLFANRLLNLWYGDFLQGQFDHITVVYLCSTAFSYEFIQALGEKIATFPNTHTVITFRKMPTLTNFVLTRKIFLHGTWDRTVCYLYTRTL